MAFPQTTLGTKVELNLGTWTDITTLVYQRAPISITSGRQNASSQVAPANCSLTLNNRDGRFSINNPTGLYYGTLGRNTPLRVSVPNSLLPSPYNTTYLRMEDDAVSFASCPAVAAIELTGSIDVRVDAQPSGYGSYVFASIWGASGAVNQRSWRFGITQAGVLFFLYTTAGTAGSAGGGLSTASLPVAVGRQCFRATLDATTGNVAFYTAAPGNIATGPWTQIGSTLAGSGAVTVFASSTTALSVGYSAGDAYDTPTHIALQGSVYDFELRSSIGGTVVAKPAFNAQTAGATSWTDGPGNAWTVSGTATLDNRSYRFHGELSQTPKASDPSVTDIYSAAAASGVLRRLQQGQTPLNSALYRAYVRLTGSVAPVAYWPCEDGTGATQIASGLGGSPMTFTGTPTLASNSSFACSAAIPVLNGAVLTGAVPKATWSANVVRFLLAVPSGGDTNGATLLSMYTTGTVARVDLVYESASSGSLTMNAYNGTGSLLFTQASITPGAVLNGAFARMEVWLQPSGGNVQGAAGGITISGLAGGESVGSTAGTLGSVSRVVFNPGGALTGTAVGHVSVQSTLDTLAVEMQSPLQAWAGETAAARVQRLCTEEGIQARIIGHAGLSAPMGDQTIQTLPNLLQECETTDRGMLFEPPTCVGVGYRTLNSLYNLAATVSASFTAAAVGAGFSPIADDLLTLNDVTATNSDGSSARQFLASGAMSVLAPPNGIGRVDTSIQVNAASDSQLAGIAQWLLHTSSDPHDRFPAIPFNMARPQTPASVALLRTGDLLAVTSPPTWIQYDEIDQLSAGFTETLGQFGVWEIDVNAVPAYPYTVFQVAGGSGLATHIDTDGTTLTSSLTTTGTAVSFTTTTNGLPVWTTQFQDFPFDVQCAGERITVVGPGTTLGIDPFLVSGATDYSAQNAALTVSSAVGVPQVATGYGTSALLVSPSGSPATFADVLGTVTAAGTIATSTGYSLWAWVYPTVTRTYQLAANWYLGAAYVSTTLTTGVSVAAGAWTLVTGTVTSPASGVNAVQLDVTDQSTPSTADTYYVWGLNVAKTSGISTSSPQGFTVVRSVNGVVKAQSSGAAVSLWFPPTIGI